MRGCRLGTWFAVLCTLACSERSGTPEEKSSPIANYCNRVCNCADTATDECVEQCSSDLKMKGNVVGKDCLSCVDTTACDRISTDCYDACTGQVAAFPDAGPPPSADGGVPGCPTGRLVRPTMCLIAVQAFCEARHVRCGIDVRVIDDVEYPDDLDSCVERNVTLLQCLVNKTLRECDVEPTLECLTSLQDASCEDLDQDSLDISANDPKLSYSQSCVDAFGSCCATIPLPSCDPGAECESEEGES